MVVLSRRDLFSVAGAAGLAVGLAACGGADDAGGEKDWSFVDDRGVTAEAAGTPSRVVAFSGAAAVLVDHGLADRIVGVFGDTSGGDTALLGDLDLGAVTVLGDQWGQFDLERYAELEPDLLITDTYMDDNLWYIPDDNRDKILELAPTIAIGVANKPLPVPIGRYTDLALALGADPEAERLRAAQQRFAAASQAVRDAVAARPGLRVLACSAAADAFYVSNPEVSADLSYLRVLGVDVVIPERTEAGGFFENLSWEYADRYPADLVILDSRDSALPPEALAAKPVWQRLPAVVAGQVAPWHPVFRFSHAGTAPLLEELADTLARTEKVT